MIVRRCGELTVEADAQGWLVRSPGRAPLPPDEWPRAWLSASEDWQLAWQLGSLIELGIGERESNSWRLPYGVFPWLFEQGYTIPILWSTWSPVSLEVAMHGVPSQSPYAFVVRYFLGDLEIGVVREGRYLQREGQVGTWLLDEACWQLLDHIETGDGRGWPGIAMIRDLCAETCATMRGFIADHEIIFPRTLRLDGRAPQISEVSIEIFKRLMRSWSGQAMLSFASRERWVHLCFDDPQIASLHDDKAGSPPAPREVAVQYVAGRVSCRETVLDGNRAIVPVRRSLAAGSASAQIRDADEAHTLSGSSLRHFTGPRFQAALVAWYTSRGYHVIPMPVGCCSGASLLAVRDGLTLAVRIDSLPAGDHLLHHATRTTAFLRRLVPGTYEPCVVLRGTCPAALKSRAEQQGIQLRDEYQAADMIDSEPITERSIATAAGERCVSTGEAIERLRMALQSDGEPQTWSSSLRSTSA